MGWTILTGHSVRRSMYVSCVVCVMCNRVGLALMRNVMQWCTSLLTM